MGNILRIHLLFKGDLIQLCFEDTNKEAGERSMRCELKYKGIEKEHFESLVYLRYQYLQNTESTTAAVH